VSIKPLRVGVVIEQWDGSPAPVCEARVAENAAAASASSYRAEHGSAEDGSAEHGSIIVIVATDAPLTPDQLRRLARRVSVGLGRVGGLKATDQATFF
jgi:L-aminopeptidase/D-esterase-like protein